MTLLVPTLTESAALTNVNKLRTLGRGGVVRDAMLGKARLLRDDDLESLIRCYHQADAAWKEGSPDNRLASAIELHRGRQVSD